MTQTAIAPERIPGLLDRLSNGATGMRPRQIVAVTLTEPCGNECKRFIYTRRDADYGFTPHRSEALFLSHNEALEALRWVSAHGRLVWKSVSIRAEIVQC